MPNRANKDLSPSADAVLWRDAVAGTAPLRRRSSALPALPVPATPEPPKGGAVLAGPRRAAPAPLDPFAGIDRASVLRLRRGLRAIEGRLDLHGMTQREAHRALTEFVAASGAAGRRCLLVITGRGLGSDRPGVLQRAVPRWLAASAVRGEILAIAAAQPRHGGAGALYVLLRRRR
jgi:DNA-nicking Smr family endonuclease